MFWNIIKSCLNLENLNLIVLNTKKIKDIE